MNHDINIGDRVFILDNDSLELDGKVCIKETTIEKLGYAYAYIEGYDGNYDSHRYDTETFQQRGIVVAFDGKSHLAKSKDLFDGLILHHLSQHIKDMITDVDGSMRLPDDQNTLTQIIELLKPFEV